MMGLVVTAIQRVGVNVTLHCNVGTVYRVMAATHFSGGRHTKASIIQTVKLKVALRLGAGKGLSAPNISAS